MSKIFDEDGDDEEFISAADAVGTVRRMQEVPGTSLKSLIEYDNIGLDGKPILSTSLRKKHEFVMAFLNLGNIGRAFQEIYDPTLNIPKATALGEDLARNDAFVSDLLALARRNVEDSASSILAEHTSILAILRDGAAANGKWSPAIAAEMARGKALGVYDLPKSKDTEVTANSEDITEATVQKVIDYLGNLKAADKKAVISLIQRNGN